MAHRTEREKDRRPVDEVIGYRPDHYAGTPCGTTVPRVQNVHEFSFVEVEPPSRRIANVRAASAVARLLCWFGGALLVEVDLDPARRHRRERDAVVPGPFEDRQNDSAITVRRHLVLHRTVPSPPL